MSLQSPARRWLTWCSRLVTESSAIAVLNTENTALPVAASCADCGTAVSGNYCPACGQETRIETPTVRHFLHEFIDQYIALEGKLGRTLRTLLLRPGQLTLDYVEGRRQRYVRPLKFYLTISVIFFGLLGVLPDANNPFLDLGSDNKPAIVIEAGKPSAQPAAGSTPSEKGPAPEPGSFEDKLEKSAAEFNKLSGADQRRTVRQKLADDAPYAMFFLLPYFALLLKWFYRKQKLRYGVHLLFSLHLHSFAFIALAVGFIPLPALFRRGLEIVIAVYVFMALRRVYGGTAKRTIWRMFWLWLFYLIAVGTSALSGVLTTMLGSDVA
jgi:hypothetical protein